MTKKLSMVIAVLAIVTLGANADYKSIQGINAASIDNNVPVVENPAYSGSRGRTFNMDKGGYSGVRKMQNAEAYGDAVNSVPEKYDFRVRQAEKKVSDEIGRPEEDAFSFGSTSSYYDKVKNHYDTTSDYPASVNPSKTIYTDGIGRQHFFGKANLIK